jgi:NitT/TauT family transport system substrate-binding protein
MRHRISSLLITITLLSGCGDHGGPGSERTIRLVTTRGSLLNMAVYVAKALGYFEQEKIAVSIDEVASAARTMQSVIGGSSDVATGGFLSVVSMNADHRPIEAFFVLDRYPGILALVSPRAQHRITRIQDLDGATVGVSGPGTDEHMMVNFVSSRNGADLAKVAVIAVGTGMSKALAFEQGSIDVVAATGTALSLIQKRHPGISSLFDLRSREGIGQFLGFDDLAYSVLYAQAGWIRTHRESVRGMARATRRGSDWVRTHSAAEIRRLLPASIRTADADVDTDAIASTVPMLSPDGRFKPEHLDAARDILAVSNRSVQTREADLSGSYTNEFVEGQGR